MVRRLKSLLFAIGVASACAGVAALILVHAMGRPAPSADPKAAALASLRREPLDVGALRDLALIAEREGRRDEAMRLMQGAASLSKRNSGVSHWLMIKALEAGDLEAAVGHADLMLRRNASIKNQILAGFILGSQDPRLARAFAAALRVAPWRPQFFWFLGEFPEFVPEGGEQIALEADRAAPRLGIDEWSYVLLAARPERQAAIWRSLNPAAAYANARSEFAGEPTPRPFNWAVAATDAASADFMRIRGSRTFSLRTTWDGRWAGTIVSQITALEPGRYRMTVVADAENIDVNQTWRFHCYAPWSRLPVALTPRGSAEKGRVNLVGEVEVKPGCLLQYIALDTDPARPGASEAVWYDVRVERVSAGKPPRTDRRPGHRPGL